MSRIRPRAFAVLFAFALAAAGCDSADPLPLEPDAPLLSSSSSTLLECPVDETRSVTREIGLLGGTVELDGHSITLPYAAVLLPTPITLTAPRSNFVEVEIHAAGRETFSFLQPVSISISYDRCTRNNIAHSDLTAWHIDTATKALLEQMGGVDDKIGRTVTFDSDHLSGFAIAN